MAVFSTTFLLAMPKYYVPNLVLLNKTRTTTITLITIVTAITIASATSIPKVALAFSVPCSTCGAHESITGNGVGDLICSSGINYPNTQINFNALVTIKVPGPAKGSVTLTATAVSQIQGMVTSGVYDPSAKTYSLSGTSTSDSACAVPGSPFTISGIIGPGVPISMTGKYDFRGTGDVTASHAKA
jgi:hypothetical protein